MNRLKVELEEAQKNPPEGISVAQQGDPKLWIITISGPKDTPYEGGKFKVSVKFPD